MYSFFSIFVFIKTIPRIKGTERCQFVSFAIWCWNICLWEVTYFVFIIRNIKILTKNITFFELNLGCILCPRLTLSPTYTINFDRKASSNMSSNVEDFSLIGNGEWAVMFDGATYSGTPWHCRVGINRKQNQVKVKPDVIEFQVTHFSCFAAILAYFFGSPTLCMEMHAYLHPPSVEKATEILLIVCCVRRDETKVWTLKTSCSSKHIQFNLLNPRPTKRFCNTSTQGGGVYVAPLWTREI